jgi:hypothetical protein
MREGLALAHERDLTKMSQITGRTQAADVITGARPQLTPAARLNQLQPTSTE